MSATSSRKKAPALQVPQSAAEADAIIREIGEHTNQLVLIGADLQRETARLKEAHERLAEPHKQACKQLEKRLQAYAEARRSELTSDGKTKQVETAAGLFGWRTRPPSVKVTGKIADIVDWLKTSYLAPKFLRTKHELDKETMLKEPDVAVTVPGISIERDVEDFYVLPAGLMLAEEA